MPDTPEWVPEGVKRAAKDYEKSAIVHRLLTDPKMKGVWEISVGIGPRGVGGPVILTEAIATLPVWQRCPNETNLSVQDKAAAALFYICLHELTDRFYAPRGVLSQQIAEWKRVRVLCDTARFIGYPRDIEERLHAVHPSRNPQLCDALHTTARYFGSLVEAYERAKLSGNRWERYNDGPKGKPNRAMVRAQFSDVILQVDQIYQPPLRTALVTIARVGFNVTVSARDIDNWRAALKKRS